MLTPIVELDPGADNEVFDRSRHKDLIGSGDGRDPCSDVDRVNGQQSAVYCDMFRVPDCSKLRLEYHTAGNA